MEYMFSVSATLHQIHTTPKLQGLSGYIKRESPAVFNAILRYSSGCVHSGSSPIHSCTPATRSCAMLAAEAVETADATGEGLGDGRGTLSQTVDHLLEVRNAS